MPHLVGFSVKGDVAIGAWLLKRMMSHQLDIFLLRFLKLGDVAEWNVTNCNVTEPIGRIW
jgi:hypothetical protein